MESIGAINLLYILSTHNISLFNNGTGSFPAWPTVIAALYVLHYLNRAVITPLVLAPSMSPIHLIIILSAVTFNYLNSSCLASWLVGYGTPITASDSGFAYDATAASSKELSGSAPYIPYLGIVLFLVGMYGNIKAENTLFKLRREEAHKRQKEGAVKNGQKTKGTVYDKVYILPPAEGYFRFILFPHYVFEWLEWFGFLLIGFSITRASGGFSATPSSSTPNIPLARFYVPLANLIINKFGLPFPFPAIVFFVNGVATTAARASWGRKWYVDKFGKKAVGRRGGFIPYF
ncbi:hypothetical protein FQN57_005858 [Myotisia sp. PD_48]|nr:hypothetical protein FQN57_005858 [Myotisia sp. PD_48]